MSRESSGSLDSGIIPSSVPQAVPRKCKVSKDSLPIHSQGWSDPEQSSDQRDWDGFEVIPEEPELEAEEEQEDEDAENRPPKTVRQKRMTKRKSKKRPDMKKKAATTDAPLCGGLLSPEGQIGGYGSTSLSSDEDWESEPMTMANASKEESLENRSREKVRKEMLEEWEKRKKERLKKKEEERKWIEEQFEALKKKKAERKEDEKKRKLEEKQRRKEEQQKEEEEKRKRVIQEQEERKRLRAEREEQKRKDKELEEKKRQKEEKERLKAEKEERKRKEKEQEEKKRLKEEKERLRAEKEERKRKEREEKDERLKAVKEEQRKKEREEEENRQKVLKEQKEKKRQEEEEEEKRQRSLLAKQESQKRKRNAEEEECKRTEREEKRQKVQHLQEETAPQTQEEDSSESEEKQDGSKNDTSEHHSTQKDSSLSAKIKSDPGSNKFSGGHNRTFPLGRNRFFTNKNNRAKDRPQLPQTQTFQTNTTSVYDLFDDPPAAPKTSSKLAKNKNTKKKDTKKKAPLQDRTNLTNSPVSLQVINHHHSQQRLAREDTPVPSLENAGSKRGGAGPRKRNLFSTGDTTEKESSLNSTRNTTEPNYSLLAKVLRPAGIKTYTRKATTRDNSPLATREVLRRDIPAKNQQDLSLSFSDAAGNKESTRIEVSEEEEQVEDGAEPVALLSPIYQETPKTHEPKTPEWRVIHEKQDGEDSEEEVDESIIRDAILRSNAELDASTSSSSSPENVIASQILRSREEPVAEEEESDRGLTSDKRVTFRDTISEQSASQATQDINTSSLGHESSYSVRSSRRAKKSPLAPNALPVSPILRGSKGSKDREGGQVVNVATQTSLLSQSKGTQVVPMMEEDNTHEVLEEEAKKCFCDMFQKLMEESVRKTTLEFMQEFADKLREEIGRN